MVTDLSLSLSLVRQYAHASSVSETVRTALFSVCDAAERASGADVTAKLADAMKAQAETISAQGDQIIELSRARGTA